MTEAIGRGIGNEEFQRMLRQSEDLERPSPHPLDRVVVNQLCEDVRRTMNAPILAIRSIFSEGRRIYPESAFRERDHVQIAVRHAGLIDGMRRLPDPAPLDSS